jgi:hypothetical protein
MFWAFVCILWLALVVLIGKAIAFGLGNRFEDIE